ncbi:hypothetical protein ACFLYH_03615, partial [Candidatus Dependentiae bacterium]
EQSLQKAVGNKLTLKEFAQKQINVAKNKHLGKNVGSAFGNKTSKRSASQIAKIEKNIKETGVLQKLLKEAKFTQRHDHQWETKLIDGNKLILRRDVGKYAHQIKRGQPPVDHWNIQLQKLNTFNQRFEPYYNYHIVVDDKFNIIETFGK